MGGLIKSGMVLILSGLRTGKSTLNLSQVRWYDL